MGEFQEKYKVDIALFDATGSTTEQISQYYDMTGYRRIDFLVQGRIPSAMAQSTLAQKYTLRLLSASNATGGGASGISSATAVFGKISTGVVIATAEKANELWLRFSTLDIAAVGATFSVNETKFTSATGNSAAYYFAGGGSAAGTVLSAGFITAFNATSNTLSSAYEAVAHTHATDATAGVVIIRPKNADSTAYLTATGSTIFNFGISKCCAHLGMDVQHIEDGKTHIAIGAYSTGSANPVCITVIREAEGPVSKKTVQTSKSMSGSTSK